MKTVLFILLATTAGAFGSAAALIQQGDVYDKRFKPQKALEYYLPAEKETPNDSALLVKITRQYVFRMDDLSSNADKLASARTALAYAERAVKAAPGESDPYLSVAIVWGKMSYLLSNREKVEASKKIKDAAEKAVRLNPQDDYAWHMLGRWHQAVSDMSTLTRGVAQMVYGSIPAASNEEAVKCFKKAIALNPGRLVHYVELGRTYAQMGRKDEAKAEITKGLAMPNKEKDDPETKARGKAALAKL